MSTVVSNGEYHQKVFPNYPEDLEVIEDTSMFCKVQCSDGLQFQKMKSNVGKTTFNVNFVVKVSVKYYSYNNLIVYASFKHTAPDKNSSEYTFKNPRKFYITADGKDKTTDYQFLYLSFYSSKGVSIQFTVSFPNDDDPVSPSRKAHLANETDEQKDKHKEVIDKILQRCKLENSQMRDIVSANKKTAFTSIMNKHSS